MCDKYSLWGTLTTNLLCTIYNYNRLKYVTSMVLNKYNYTDLNETPNHVQRVRIAIGPLFAFPGLGAAMER